MRHGMRLAYLDRAAYREKMSPEVIAMRDLAAQITQAEQGARRAPPPRRPAATRRDQS